MPKRTLDVVYLDRKPECSKSKRNKLTKLKIYDQSKAMDLYETEDCQIRVHHLNEPVLGLVERMDRMEQQLQDMQQQNQDMQQQNQDMQQQNQDMQQQNQDMQNRWHYYDIYNYYNQITHKIDPKNKKRYGGITKYRKLRVCKARHTIAHPRLDDVYLTRAKVRELLGHLPHCGIKRTHQKYIRKAFQEYLSQH